MTNRELLREIKDIKKSLSRVEEDLTLPEQAEELQEVFEKEAEIEAEIERLETQLANVDQYYSVYDEEMSKRYIAKVNNALGELDVEEAQLAADLARINSRLKEIDFTTDFVGIEELLAIAQQEEEDYENANLETKTASEIASMEESIQKTRQAVVELTADRDSATREKEKLMADIAAIQTRQEEIAKEKETHNRHLQTINQADQKGVLVDPKAVAADQSKLEQAKESLKAYNAKETYLSFNCINELESLENDIQSGKVDKNQIVTRLQTIKDRAPYLPTDIPVELEDNLAAQRMTEAQIADLQAKLGNDDNYIIAETESEKLNKEIVMLEFRQSDYEARAKENEAFLVQKTRAKVRTVDDIDEYEDTLKDLEETIAKVQVKLENNQLSKRERREYEDDLRACRQEANKVRKQLEELYETKSILEQQIQGAKVEQKRLPRLQAGTEKLLNDKRQRLESRNIDIYAKKIDEDKLHDLVAGLNALKARETYLNANIPDKLDVLISKVQGQELVSNKEKVKKGIAVVFDKINKNIIEKVKDTSFQKRIKAALGAIIIVISSATAISIFKNSSTKLNRGGLSKETFKVKDFDFETDSKFAHQIQVDSDTYEYEVPETNPDLEQVEKKSIEEMAVEVIQGKWGNGIERKEKLKEAGYTDAEIIEIQEKVNAYYNKKQTVTKPVENQEQQPIVSTPETVVPPEAVLPPEAFEPINPQNPVINPDTKPDQIITGPIYTVDGDEEIKDEIFHPVTPPTPDKPDNKQTIDVKVNKGDTLLVETDKGVIAVDNSDGQNYADIDKDVSYDYTSSSAFDSVHYDDKTGAIDVTVDKQEVVPQPEEQRQLDQQILDDYEQILREMGISSNTYEETGRTR